MSNEKNDKFMQQFDKGVRNPSPAEPMPPSPPFGFKTPDGVFHETVPERLVGSSGVPKKKK